MTTTSRDEPGGRGAEHELDRLSPLAAHLQAPSFFMDGDDRTLLEAAAEVGDARAGAQARDRSRWAEHEWMVRRAVADPTDTFRSMLRRTKIVATIGPASREPDTLLRMVQAGMDVARLNYSHGTLEEHAETVRRVRDAAGHAGRPVAILQDLPGPKLRIGPLREDVVELKPGERLTFSCGGEEPIGDARHMSISWEGLADAVEKGAVMYLADGSVRLRVVDVRSAAHEIETEIEVGGAA